MHQLISEQESLVFPWVGLTACTPGYKGLKDARGFVVHLTTSIYVIYLFINWYLHISDFPQKSDIIFGARVASHLLLWYMCPSNNTQRFQIVEACT